MILSCLTLDVVEMVQRSGRDWAVMVICTGTPSQLAQQLTPVTTFFLDLILITGLVHSMSLDCRQEKKLNNQSLQCGFEVFYLHNIVGPCSRWVWVLECWNFFPGLLAFLFPSHVHPQDTGPLSWKHRWRGFRGRSCVASEVNSFFISSFIWFLLHYRILIIII